MYMKGKCSYRMSNTPTEGRKFLLEKKIFRAVIIPINSQEMFIREGSIHYISNDPFKISIEPGSVQ